MVIVYAAGEEEDTTANTALEAEPDIRTVLTPPTVGALYQKEVAVGHALVDSTTLSVLVIGSVISRRVMRRVVLLLLGLTA